MRASRQQKKNSLADAPRADRSEHSVRLESRAPSDPAKPEPRNRTGALRTRLLGALAAVVLVASLISVSALT